VIVGSGAYNLFIIVGLCIGSVPSPQTRKVERLPVFWLILIVAILSYIWIYLILAAFSDGRVELWEALITLSFYPLFVFVAWCVDRKFFNLFKRCRKDGSVAKSTRVLRNRKGAVNEEEAGRGRDYVFEHGLTPCRNVHISHSQYACTRVEYYEEQRGKYLEMVRQVHAEHPTMSVDQLSQLAIQRSREKQHRSQNYYRLQATRSLVGASRKRVGECMLLSPV
jgi:solute carrier family 8 (sodium/calcium exchanger)